MPKITLEINAAVLAEIDQHLARLERPTTAPLHAGLRAAGKVVRDRNYALLPKPGYPGDKPGLPPLRETIAVKTIEYHTGTRAVVVGMVGYDWLGGQHAHNVEYGHRIATKKTGKLIRPQADEKFKSYRGGRFSTSGVVAGRFDLEKAAEQTKPQRDELILASALRSIEQTMRKTTVKVG